uniref:hypothetical protein n=1 Tax=Bacillus altitudinis TaxID=293387 RepID=UPI001C92EE7E
ILVRNVGIGRGKTKEVVNGIKMMGMGVGVFWGCRRGVGSGIGSRMGVGGVIGCKSVVMMRI